MVERKEGRCRKESNNRRIIRRLNYPYSRLTIRYSLTIIVGLLVDLLSKEVDFLVFLRKLGYLVTRSFYQITSRLFLLPRRLSLDS